MASEYGQLMVFLTSVFMSVLPVHGDVAPLLPPLFNKSHIRTPWLRLAPSTCLAEEESTDVGQAHFTLDFPRLAVCDLKRPPYAARPQLAEAPMPERDALLATSGRRCFIPNFPEAPFFAQVSIN